VTDGGELLSKGKLEVWREGDTLCFFRRDRNLYTGKDNLYSGELPVQAIRFYRLCGGMRTETRVSGGGVLGRLGTSVFVQSAWTRHRGGGAVRTGPHRAGAAR
jgi:hypothetical protein